jgi:hypothetical protein
MASSRRKTACLFNLTSASLAFDLGEVLFGLTNVSHIA